VGIRNVTFEVASAYELPFDDSSVDVVYADHLFQSINDPVRALREASRVLRPGGFVALREIDHGSMVHAPTERALEVWVRVYRELCRQNGGEPDAGRFLAGWVQAAGLMKDTLTTSTMTIADDETRSDWAELWATRVKETNLARYWIDGGHLVASDIVAIAAAVHRWADRKEGFWAYLFVELIAVKPAWLGLDTSP